MIYTGEPRQRPPRCPACGKEDPEDRFFCPSWPDRCDGCEQCQHAFHEYNPEVTPITGDSA